MIRLTIQRKVFLATFALATSMALLLILITRWNLELGFERYTTSAEFSRIDWMIRNIEAEYAEHGNWDFIRNDPGETWRRFLRPPGVLPEDQLPRPLWQRNGGPPRPNFPPPSQLAGRAPSDLLSLGPRLALLDPAGGYLLGNPEGVHAPAQRPIRHNGREVGRLALLAAPTSVSELGAAFLASQTRNLFLSGLAALFLSLLAAWLLARHFLAPIRDLTEGARKIAGNRLDTRIPVRRDDEFGELASDFNSMAEQLARAEQSRRAWISDSSHELRTPLAVLRAEIEALQDGIRIADPATLERLLRQTQQLTRLVDDLRLTLDHDPATTDLALVPMTPIAVLRDVISAFAKRYQIAGIAIDTTRLNDRGWHIPGDIERLTQVFSNLLENTLRYTHRGGSLRIAAQAEGRRLVLQFDDTAPAPPKAALPRLFERFFRAEPSRSRAHGGSGLGLAICKSIVEAHGGVISACLSELGGLCIRIQLPLDIKP